MPPPEQTLGDAGAQRQLTELFMRQAGAQAAQLDAAAEAVNRPSATACTA